MWAIEEVQQIFAFFLIQDMDCQLQCAQHLYRNYTSRKDLKPSFSCKETSARKMLFKKIINILRKIKENIGTMKQTACNKN